MSFCLEGIIDSCLGTDKAHGSVLIPVVLRNCYRSAESKLSTDRNHSSGTFKEITG